MIPLLTRIAQQLAQCPDPPRAAELLAERASYLARAGDFAGANEILAQLRRDFGDGRHVRVSVWIMLVEGLVLYFRDIDATARDRICRAYVLSHAAKQEDLARLTSSWLANVELNRADYRSMLAHILRCAPFVQEEENPVNLRISLVVADAFMYADQVPEARVWYERARRQATGLGDEVSLAALIYNKAVSGLTRIRILAATSSPLDEALLRFVAMEVSSAYHFHWGSGQKAMAHLIDACRARVFLLEGRDADALPLFESLCSGGGSVLNLRPELAILRLEYALCLARLHVEASAREYLLAASLDECDSMTLDDQLVYLHLFRLLGGILGISQFDRPVADKFAEVKRRFDEERDSLRQGLHRFAASASSLEFE